MGVKRLVCLASGRGSNFAALADAVTGGAIPNAVMAGLVCNKVGAPALELARQRQIPAYVVESKAFRAGGKLERDRYEEKLVAVLEPLKPDFLLLAGYMLVVGARVLDRWPHRIVNIHPSLLPSFRGLHPQRQALEAGVRWAGCTVHLVDASLDGGPILAQSPLEVRDDDTETTLAERLLPVEHQTYIETVRRLCTEIFTVDGLRVRWGK